MRLHARLATTERRVRTTEETESAEPELRLRTRGNSLRTAYRKSPLHRAGPRVAPGAMMVWLPGPEPSTSVAPGLQVPAACPLARFPTRHARAGHTPRIARSGPVLTRVNGTVRPLVGLSDSDHLSCLSAGFLDLLDCPCGSILKDFPKL